MRPPSDKWNKPHMYKVLILQGKTEITCSVSLGEEKSQWGSYQCIWKPERGWQLQRGWRQAFFCVVPSDRARRNGFKLKHKKLHLNIRKHFTVSVTKHWNTLWSLPPWRVSKAIWTLSWPADSRWPCLSRGFDEKTSNWVPSNCNHYVILWKKEEQVLTDQVVVLPFRGT